MLFLTDKGDFCGHKIFLLLSLVQFFFFKFLDHICYLYAKQKARTAEAPVLVTQKCEHDLESGGLCHVKCWVYWYLPQGSHLCCLGGAWVHMRKLCVY